MVRWFPHTDQDRGNDSALPKEKLGTSVTGPGGGAGTGSGFNYPYGAPTARPRWTPPGARGVSAVTFLAGVWLLLAPFVLDYAPVAAGLGAYWNDLVLGAVVALLALVRVVAPERVLWLSLVNAVLGAWLVAAPFVLDYHARAYAYEATGNDVAVGLLVFVMAVVSAATTYQQQRRPKQGEPRT